MLEIIPLIFARDSHDFKEKLNKVPIGVNRVQVIISAGSLGGHKSMGAWVLEDVGWAGSIDVYLETLSPLEMVNEVLRMGVGRIIFDTESCPSLADVEAVIGEIKSGGGDVGLSVGLDSSLAFLSDVCEGLDLIQLKLPEEFDDGYVEREVLPKISFIKTNYPNIPLSIAGKIDESTAENLLRTGVDALVI